MASVYPFALPAVTRLMPGLAVYGPLARSTAFGLLLLAMASGGAHAQTIRRGSENYAAHCAGCHGAAGIDAPQLSPGLRPHSLADCSWMQMMSDATLFAIIKNGGRSAGMRDMPAIEPSVSDQEIQGIVAFIRTFCAQGQP